MLISMTLSLAAVAQDEEVGSIATDRPVQSETPTVVPKNYLQFEQGVYFERGIGFGTNYSGLSRTDQLNYNLLFKYGLVKNLEFRFNFDYLNQEQYLNDESNGSVGGVSGPNIGFKYSFLKDDGQSWKPNLSLSAHSQFDWWGREEFQPENANLNFRATVGKNFTDNWYGILGYGINFEDGNSDATGHFYVVQTGYTFAGKLTAILEYYGNNNSNLEIDESAINGALVYLLKDNHQFDVSFGKGLSDEWYDYYLAIGYSMRFSR